MGTTIGDIKGDTRSLDNGSGVCAGLLLRNVIQVVILAKAEKQNSINPRSHILSPTLATLCKL